MVMYSPALLCPGTVNIPENVSLMQKYLSLLSAVTVTALSKSNAGITAEHISTNFCGVLPVLHTFKCRK